MSFENGRQDQPGTIWIEPDRQGAPGRLKKGGLPVDKVKPNSPADRIGLKKGDIVHQVNEIKINKMDDYLKAIAKYRLRNSLGLIVQRGRYAYNVTLTP
ncbi:MAG: PDZ domain-containing protein [Deltaproteobacteria bacterium]|nr:PDZ domain-containing protein [Deltaproteobacteria bacterium]